MDLGFPSHSLSSPPVLPGNRISHRVFLDCPEPLIFQRFLPPRSCVALIEDDALIGDGYTPRSSADCFHRLLCWPRSIPSVLSPHFLEPPSMVVGQSAPLAPARSLAVSAVTASFLKPVRRPLSGNLSRSSTLCQKSRRFRHVVRLVIGKAGRPSAMRPPMHIALWVWTLLSVDHHRLEMLGARESRAPIW